MAAKSASPKAKLGCVRQKDRQASLLLYRQAGKGRTVQENGFIPWGVWGFTRFSAIRATDAAAKVPGIGEARGSDELVPGRR